jgi:metal-responsive CopG/Arc/MetJ family transcriptional regulator
MRDPRFVSVALPAELVERIDEVCGYPRGSRSHFIRCCVETVLHERGVELSECVKSAVEHGPVQGPGIELREDGAAG